MKVESELITNSKINKQLLEILVILDNLLYHIEIK